MVRNKNVTRKVALGTTNSVVEYESEETNAF